MEHRFCRFKHNLAAGYFVQSFIDECVKVIENCRWVAGFCVDIKWLVGHSAFCKVHVFHLVYSVFQCDIQVNQNFQIFLDQTDLSYVMIAIE